MPRQAASRGLLLTSVAATLPLAAVRELEQNPEPIVDHRYNLTVRYLAMAVAGPLQSAEARQWLCWALPYSVIAWFAMPQE